MPSNRLMIIQNLFYFQGTNWMCPWSSCLRAAGVCVCLCFKYGRGNEEFRCCHFPFPRKFDYHFKGKAASCLLKVEADDATLIKLPFYVLLSSLWQEPQFPWWRPTSDSRRPLRAGRLDRWLRWGHRETLSGTKICRKKERKKNQIIYRSATLNVTR